MKLMLAETYASDVFKTAQSEGINMQAFMDQLQELYLLELGYHDRRNGNVISNQEVEKNIQKIREKYVH